MNIEDRTGLPCTLAEYEEAIACVSKFAMGPELMKLPPELAVQLLNIRRCLVQGHALVEAVEQAQKPPGAGT